MRATSVEGPQARVQVFYMVKTEPMNVAMLRCCAVIHFLSLLTKVKCNQEIF